MANNPSVQAINERLMFLTKVQEGVEILLARAKEPIHTAILESVGNKSDLIPVDSGALKKSLLNPKDRAHIFEISEDANQIIYGSSLPQAKIYKDKLPTPSTDGIVNAVVDEIVKILLEEV